MERVSTVSGDRATVLAGFRWAGRLAGVALGLAAAGASAAQAGLPGLYAGGGFTGDMLHVTDLVGVGDWQGAGSTTRYFFDGLLSEQNRSDQGSQTWLIHSGEEEDLIFSRDYAGDDQTVHYDNAESSTPIELSSFGLPQIVVTSSSDQSVPEPMALTLFGMGLAGLGWARRGGTSARRR